MPPSNATRWIQLGLGLVCMMTISSPQYVWTLFAKPIGAALGTAPAALQVTFSLLIVLQTFFSPLQGWMVERFGPRNLIALGTVLSGLSWVLASQVSSLTMLYLTYGVVGGLGTGIVTSASLDRWSVGSPTGGVLPPGLWPPAMAWAPSRRRFRFRTPWRVPVIKPRC